MSKRGKFFMLIGLMFMSLALGTTATVPISCVFMTVGLVSFLFAVDNY